VTRLSICQPVCEGKAHVRLTRSLTMHALKFFVCACSHDSITENSSDEQDNQRDLAHYLEGCCACTAY
jgi:hypothetical protein